MDNILVHTNYERAIRPHYNRPRECIRFDAADCLGCYSKRWRHNEEKKKNAGACTNRTNDDGHIHSACNHHSSTNKIPRWWWWWFSGCGAEANGPSACGINEHKSKTNDMCADGTCFLERDDNGVDDGFPCSRRSECANSAASTDVDVAHFPLRSVCDHDDDDDGGDAPRAPTQCNREREEHACGSFWPTGFVCLLVLCICRRMEAPTKGHSTCATEPYICMRAHMFAPSLAIEAPRTDA